MELSTPLTTGIGPLAGAASIARLPGIAMFCAGLFAGALTVALARGLTSWRRPAPLEDGASLAAGPPAAVPARSVARRASGSWAGRPLCAAPTALTVGARVPAAPGAAERGADAARPAAVSAGQAGLGLGAEPAGPDGGSEAAGPGQDLASGDPGLPEQVPSLRIGVLGSLTVNGQAGALVPAQSQLIVALALQRDGLSNRQLRTLLGADAGHPKPADSLRQLIARTRRALGRAADGREWIEHLGHGRYALHPDARVDCREFETLIAAGITSADPAPLAEALGLIRGQPFTGCYYWWLEPATVEAMTAKIVAAAHALAKIRLAGGDPAAAVRAARVGLAADSSAEQLWRVTMRAEHAAGNLAGVRGAWSRCLDVIAEVAADGQPDSATSAVYSELLTSR